MARSMGTGRSAEDKVEEKSHKDRAKELKEQEDAYKRIIELKAKDREDGAKEELDALYARLGIENANTDYINKKLYDATKERIEEEKKAAKEAEEKNQKSAQRMTNAFVGAVGGVLSSTRRELESSMDSLIGMRASMAYNINGSGSSMSSMAANINNALLVSNVVKQESLYKNLQSLLESGVVYNAEQRAYLATLSDELGMAFRADNANLNRLINLQREDLSSQRMAIESSLKTFLNQNYQTSLYIKDGFASVSEALFESQSLMTADNAMAYEAVIQKWMGSLSSVGMSSQTINSLASAIDAAASGNVSALGSGRIGNLVYMGATRSNVEIGDMLNAGLTADSVDALISGIVSYIQTMAGHESNVTKTALADAFGITTSDIIAATKLRNATATGSISTDIGSLLGSVDTYITSVQKINNALDNLTYGSAASIALADDNGLSYLNYKIGTTLADTAADILKGQTIKISPLGVGVDLDVGQIAQAATDLGAITSAGGRALVGALFDGISVKNMFGGATGVYNALANTGGSFTNQGSMTTLLKMADTQKSGAQVQSTGSDDMAENIKVSSKQKGAQEVEADKIETDSKDIDDLYDALMTIKDVVDSKIPDDLPGAMSSVTYNVHSVDPAATITASYSSDDAAKITSIDTNVALTAKTVSKILQFMEDKAKEEEKEKEEEKKSANTAAALGTFAAALAKGL